MDGYQKGLLDATIYALDAAYRNLLTLRVDEALKKVQIYGKSDTLGLDALPEIVLIKILREYHNQAAIITEETGFAGGFDLGNNGVNLEPIFVCDPTDRSSSLHDFLNNKKADSSVGEILHSAEAIAEWEQKYSGPASITGASGAATCVVRGIPIFSVMINYLTLDLFVACSSGCYSYKLPRLAKEINLQTVLNGGQRIYFRGTDTTNIELTRRFVTFTGKSGYLENLIDSNIIPNKDINKYLVYDKPGGPLRILYLSELQPQERALGFILANGEKIGEWIHWLTFVRFGRHQHEQNTPALHLHEVYQSRPGTKDGVLMATPPAYSIFSCNTNGCYLDMRRFADLARPSQFRSTLLVTPADNFWIGPMMTQYGFRQIKIN